MLYLMIQIMIIWQMYLSSDAFYDDKDDYCDLGGLSQDGSLTYAVESGTTFRCARYRNFSFFEILNFLIFIKKEKGNCHQ